MTVKSRSYDILFDSGRHPRAKLGFVLLATEQTIPDDMYALCPPGIGLHFARVDSPDSITRETLAEIAPELSRAAGTLLPDGSLDVVTYACTSGSLVIGEGRVHALLKQGAPAARPSSIIAAVIRSLRAVGARRLVVATPYVDGINTVEKKYLEDSGFDVLAIEGLNIEHDSDMVRVSPAFIRDFALSLDCADADVIFVSCGALRTIDVLQEIEDISGKPVIASNQAMLWDALALAGINDPIPGYGRLLAMPGRSETLRHQLTAVGEATVS